MKRRPRVHPFACVKANVIFSNNFSFNELKHYCPEGSPATAKVFSGKALKRSTTKLEAAFRQANLPPGRLSFAGCETFPQECQRIISWWPAELRWARWSKGPALKLWVAAS